MAQTGFTPISIYYSSTASVVPTAGNLVPGELAINTADGRLYYKDSAGVVQTIATKDTAAGTFTSITDSGNLTFTGTGNRIRGDFTNATVTNRVYFQSSTTNGSTFIGVIPNGTSVQSGIVLEGDSAQANGSVFSIINGQGTTEVRIASGIRGTGTYLPLTMYTGGSERLRIDTSGNVGIGSSSPSGKLELTGNSTIRWQTTDANYINAYATNPAKNAYIGLATDASNHVWKTSGTESMRIDANGLVGIGLTPSGTTVKLQVSTDALISGLTVGKGGGAGASNTAVGVQALTSNTTGANGVAFGSQALILNTTGNANSAFGNSTLYNNTTGGANTAVGFQSLVNNTTASNNTAVGYQAGYANTTGNGNVFLGYQAGYASATGTALTYIGYAAGTQQTSSATDNTGVGYGALNGIGTGGGNTAVGKVSLTNNTSGYVNTAMGVSSMQNCTTGYGNAAFGHQALVASTTGFYNTAVGYTALSGITTGNTNVGVGQGAGYAITTGSKNSILGSYSGNQGGLDIRTASNYIVLSDGDGNPRYYSTGTTDSYWNATSGSGYCTHNYAIAGVIKTNTYYQVSNTSFYIVNSSAGVYLTAGGTSWTSNSDERLKENLTPIENGLNKVCSLRSVIGNYIDDENKTKKPFLIAQDVEKVLPEAVNVAVLKGDETETKYLGVSYTDTIPLLVAAIKELNAKVTALEAQLGAK